MGTIIVEAKGTRLETTSIALAQLAIMSIAEIDSEPSEAAGRAPAIGQPWPEQGGIYAGIMRGVDGQPDYHLVVPTAAAANVEKITWGGAGEDEPGAANDFDGHANTESLVNSEHGHPAAEWAAGLEIDGHSDFYLPSRRELALCYANVPELFEKRWHWSSTQCSPGDAWFQGFDVGSQYGGHKGDEFRARAVRKVVATSPL